MYITPRHLEPQAAPPPPPAPRPSRTGRCNTDQCAQEPEDPCDHGEPDCPRDLWAGAGQSCCAIARHISATSIIYVSPNFPKTLTDDREQQYQYETYIQEEIHSVTRYDVIADAIKKLPPGTWQFPGESEESAVNRLQGSLEIDRIANTYQVGITLQGGRPGRLAEIVNAVTNTYIEKAKDEEFYGRDERLDTLRQERARIQSELDSLLQEQARHRQVPRRSHRERRGIRSL